MFNLNLPAAAVAALATFLIGGPWYSNALFGERWRQAMGISDAKPGHPAKVFGFAYLFSLIATGFLSTLITPGAGALAGLQTGVTVGLCFVATSFGVNYMFANWPGAALLIDGGYHIAQFAAFGLILGLWPA
ncbi:MAG TPA: DUF1761 domain-containing protein [Steroidobacteraceae bacterium]